MKGQHRRDSSAGPNSCAACRSLSGASRDVDVLEAAAGSVLAAGAADRQYLQLFVGRGSQPAHPRPRRRHGCIPGYPVEMNDFTTTTTFRYVRNVLYLKDATGGARIETEQPPHVRPGTWSRPRASRRVTPGKPILRNAIFRVAGEASAAGAANSRNRCHGNVFTPDHDAALVRMEGHFLSMLRSRPSGSSCSGSARGVRCQSGRHAGDGCAGAASDRAAVVGHRGVFISVGAAADVPAVPALRRTTCASWRPRPGGRFGTQR